VVLGKRPDEEEIIVRTEKQAGPGTFNALANDLYSFPPSLLLLLLLLPPFR